MSWKLIGRLSAVAVTSLGGTSAYIYGSSPDTKLKKLPNFVSKSEPKIEWDYNWDHRDCSSIVKPLTGDITLEKETAYLEKLEKHRSKAIRHIILIRHGQYNLDGAIDSERTLTEVGREQAKFTGKRIAEMKVPIDNVVISTMARAQETGKIVMEQLPHFKDIPIKFEPMIEGGPPFEPVPPMEYFNPPPWEISQQGSRIEAGFRSLIHRADPSQEKDSYTLIVCHRNVIRYFVTRALQLPTESWLRFDLHHASITWLIVYPDGRARVKFYGDCGHMKMSHFTEN